eukprot:TRINITY_DN556_c1_g1_i1.p1 TRINITY_DN556_c1_g1~~TRINITY_DN556_c1_g1_i1.p1  ORF type:complete len:213 (-),score=52.00 TRINITY_DN556_c1_g1_i1:121-759(-)
MESKIEQEGTQPEERELEETEESEEREERELEETQPVEEIQPQPVEEERPVVEEEPVVEEPHEDVEETKNTLGIEWTESPRKVLIKTKPHNLKAPFGYDLDGFAHAPYGWTMKKYPYKTKMYSQKAKHDAFHDPFRALRIRTVKGIIKIPKKVAEIEKIEKIPKKVPETEKIAKIEEVEQLEIKKDEKDEAATLWRKKMLAKSKKRRREQTT